MAKQQDRATAGTTSSTSAGATTASVTTKSSSNQAAQDALSGKLARSGESTFGDLGSVDWAASAIEELAADGIVQGDGAGNFRPNDPVNQAECIKIVAGVMGAKPAAAAAGEEWFEPYMKIKPSACVNGDPAHAMTRGDVAHVVSAFKGFGDPPGLAYRFSDLEPSNEHFDALMAAADAGIFKGDASGSTMRPGDRVTRAEAAVVAQRVPGAPTDLDAAEDARLKAMSTPDLLDHLRQLGVDGRTLQLGSDLYEDQEADLGSAAAIVEVPVALFRFWNADADVSASLDRANDIYGADGIHLNPVVNRVVTEAEVDALVGTADDSAAGDSTPLIDYTCDVDGLSMTGVTDLTMRLYDEFGSTGIATAVWVPYDDAPVNGFAQPDDGINLVVIDPSEEEDTFAHEVGHLLQTSYSHDVSSDTNNLMDDGTTRDKSATGDRLEDWQVELIRTSPLTYLNGYVS